MFTLMILEAQIQTVGDKSVISGLHWYASDLYGIGILIMVSGVGCVSGDFSQTAVPEQYLVTPILLNTVCIFLITNHQLLF